MYKYKKISLMGGKKIDQHRLIYSYVFGPIPEGIEIHHKDGNGKNNCISNFEAKPKGKHAKCHFPDGPGNINPQYLGINQRKTGEEGKAWCYFCQVFHDIEEFTKDLNHWNGVSKICKKGRAQKRNHGFGTCSGIPASGPRTGMRRSLWRG